MGNQSISPSRSKAVRSAPTTRSKPRASSRFVIVVSCFFLSGGVGQSRPDAGAAAGAAVSAPFFTLLVAVDGGGNTRPLLGPIVVPVDPESLETVLCELTPVQENGEFTILLRVPSTLVGPYWFGVIAGDGGASGLASVRIQIVPPSVASGAGVELTGW